LQDARLLVGVHFVEPVRESTHEGFDCLDQLQAGRRIVDLGFDCVSLGT
jgi:hypothetical protein